MRSDQGKKQTRCQRYSQARKHKQHAGKNQRIRQQLLGTLAAFKSSDPHQGGDQRLAHRFRNQVDEEPGDQRRNQKRLERVTASEDSGYRKLFHCRRDFHHQCRHCDRGNGAKDAAVDTDRLNGYGVGTHWSRPAICKSAVGNGFGNSRSNSSPRSSVRSMAERDHS